ncbi:DUF2959 domain-containing protein [Pelagicoccus sp. NFK12]|uniref:DUF2959 domain-containing protein n=1 Tax=Pelagicoccus enzymogenes TaxID=2773457 RepID=A0A927F6T4_9BACT|nr:DUF2959 family protein [Pelagicoccus enzymogenes]MBD5778924.1 DUF2959 domain-containing protein [Pelagicoccus enzymogenes]MDQ8197332.1 DUF2959 family protein [Pelagicoccus enzymogenes]
MKSVPLLLASFCLLLCSCQSAYYGAMEKFGVHKRDILVDRVEEAREAQEEAKEQFESAFEEFLAVSEVDVSELKAVYDRLQAAFNESEAKAKAVRSRIKAIDEVSKALFKEWEGELEQYTSPELRAVSAEQLESTQKLSKNLIQAMDGAAAKMDPVLNAFRDQVLFLKHNLNAQAIAALNKTSLALREEVEVLIKQMEASIDEANAFVAQMRS